MFTQESSTLKKPTVHIKNATFWKFLVFSIGNPNQILARNGKLKFTYFGGAVSIKNGILPSLPTSRRFNLENEEGQEFKYKIQYSFLSIRFLLYACVIFYILYSTAHFKTIHVLLLVSALIFAISPRLKRIES